MLNVTKGLWGAVPGEGGGGGEGLTVAPNTQGCVAGGGCVLCTSPGHRSLGWVEEEDVW